jgi:hypothetical protein
MTQNQEEKCVGHLCSCCDRVVGDREWDGIYGACHGCAWCCSLGHDECHHGACREGKS